MYSFFPLCVGKSSGNKISPKGEWEYGSIAYRKLLWATECMMAPKVLIIIEGDMEDARK